MQSRPVRLLLVDPDRVTREALHERLKEGGFEVFLAADGVAGMELTREAKPDLLLWDYAAPGFDAPELCRAIRREQDLRGIHVIVLAEDASYADRILALDAGADEVVAKNVEARELVARARAALRGRRIVEELAAERHRASLAALAVALEREINNPLTAMFGHIELILQYVEKGDPVRMRYHVRQAGEVASRIAEVAQRLVSLHEIRTHEHQGANDSERG